MTLSPSTIKSSLLERHWSLLVLIVIVVIGAALRILRIDAQGVWYDESFSIAHSVRSLPELFNILILDVVHPPLHYLVLHWWFQIAGFGVIQARLVSAVLGTLSIPLLYLLARHFTNSTTSLLASFLLAISQMAIYFSQEARPYAQAQFLSLLAALAFLSFLRKPDFIRTAWFAVVSAALLFTHYYGAGTLLALGIYWLIFRRDFSPMVFRRLAATVVLLVLTFLPWLSALKSGGMLTQQRLVRTSAAPSTKPTAIAPITALVRFSNGKFESIEAAGPARDAILVLAIFMIPALASLWLPTRDSRNGAVFGILLALVPTGLAIVVGSMGVIFNFRHYSFAVPGYYLAVAIGWQFCFKTTTSRSIWLAIATGVSILALGANSVATKPDYRAGLLPMAIQSQPGDCVTAWPRVWNSKLHYAWEVYYRDRGPLELVPFTSIPATPDTCQRLWVLRDRTWWMNSSKSATQASMSAVSQLSQKYKLVQQYAHPDIDLQLWQR